MFRPGAHRATRLLRAAAGVLCAASWLVSSGCLFGGKKQPRVYTPAPVVSKPPPQPSPIDTSTPVPVLGIEPATPVSGAPPGTPTAVTLPPPPQPAPPKPPPAKPSPPVTVVETPPPPLPAKPVSILSAQEQRQLTQKYEGHVEAARRALARIEGKALSPSQAEDEREARNFLLLAEQERAGDLPTAVRLAERAERLATDLLARLL